MTVAQRACAPMFARRERHLPFRLGKTFPVIELDDARKTKVVCEVADAARHHADFRMRQFAQRRFVKMIEMRVRQQHHVNRRQILDFEAGALDPFQQKKPVREIGINQHVQVRELDQERGMADPGDGDLAVFKFGKNRPLMFAVARCEQSLPDQLAEKRGRVEMLCRRQILERTRQFPARSFFDGGRLIHKILKRLSALRFE